MTTKTLGDRVKDALLIFLGAVLLVICLALMKSNMNGFIVFFALYVGMFIVIYMVYLYKKITVKDKEFNTIINISIYTLCLLLVIIMFCIYQMMQVDPNAPQGYMSPTSYRRFK